MSLEEREVIYGAIKLRVWPGCSLNKEVKVLGPNFRGQIKVFLQNGAGEEQILMANIMYLLDKIQNNALTFRGRQVVITSFADDESRELAYKLRLPFKIL